jgi:hypothetical protein
MIEFRRIRDNIVLLRTTVALRALVATPCLWHYKLHQVTAPLAFQSTDALYLFH